MSNCLLLLLRIAGSLLVFRFSQRNFAPLTCKFHFCNPFIMFCCNFHFLFFYNCGWHSYGWMILIALTRPKSEGQCARCWGCHSIWNSKLSTSFFNLPSWQQEEIVTMPVLRPRPLNWAMFEAMPELWLKSLGSLLSCSTGGVESIINTARIVFLAMAAPYKPIQKRNSRGLKRNCTTPQWKGTS